MNTAAKKSSAGNNSVLDGKRKCFEYIRLSGRPIRREFRFGKLQKERITMSRFFNHLSAAILAATLFAGAGAAISPAAAAADPAAVKKANDTCKAQINEQARYNAMSWYAKRKAVKKCVSEMLAGH
jgi:hypothetical protein